MQGMTEFEIEALVKNHQNLLGLELQICLYNGHTLQLKFANRNDLCWMTFSFKPGVPFFFFSKGNQDAIPNLKKPLNLFIRSHFIGRKLKQYIWRKDLGRVLELQFEGNATLSLLFILIPGRVNIEARAAEKTVYALKPKAIVTREMPPIGFIRSDVRTNSFFAEVWENQRQKEKKETPKSEKLSIIKKQNGLRKMREKLEEQTKDFWSELGEWLKTSGRQNEIPEKWKRFYDSRKSLSWNIEYCFQEAKKNQAKILGTQQRIRRLETEIATMQRGGKAGKEPTKGFSLLAQADLRGKTIDLPAGRLFIGKSGTDNLKLLRKAKPWYLWLHIRDYPGAYGILEKQRSLKELDRESLEKAAIAVIKQSLPKSKTGKFDLIYAECRYVRPIKGANSGQVTYSHEKVLTVRV